MAVGDDLTCTSDVTLASYSFIDSSGTVTNDDTVSLSNDGPFSYTCTASVPTDPPCSVSDSVTGTAVGKNISLLYSNYHHHHYHHRLYQVKAYKITK